jgi:hypothetical protein
MNFYAHNQFKALVANNEVGTAQWEPTVEVAVKQANKRRAVLKETRVSKP